MSEGVPKRKFGDVIQVMNTDRMQILGLANKKGTVIKVLKGDSYVIILSGSDIGYTIDGASLRAWVEPLKGDLK